MGIVLSRKIVDGDYLFRDGINGQPRLTADARFGGNIFPVCNYRVNADIE